MCSSKHSHTEFEEMSQSGNNCSSQYEQKSPSCMPLSMIPALIVISANSGTRTHTPITGRAPQARAAANYAMFAYCVFLVPRFQSPRPRGKPTQSFHDCDQGLYERTGTVFHGRPKSPAYYYTSSPSLPLHKMVVPDRIELPTPCSSDRRSTN